jgi:hypothetical protein
MANFSSINKQIGKLISTKPILLTPEELEEAGSQINLVGIDATKSISENQIKSFSPRLLNWVEPYIISGIRKTLFYTEVNSGLKVGDRVFIVNGNYDNDSLIKIDKYKKGRDGYKVIYVNKCQIVLDINYTGVLPWNNDELDNFIKVHYVKDKEQFKHVNRQITTRGGNFEYKFSYYQNNIIFVDNDYDPINNWGQTLGITGSPGFYVRDDYDESSNGTYSWTNITSEFMSGSYSVALSTTYETNNRVKILNDSFTFDGFEFKEGFVYKWGIKEEHDAIPGTQSQWVVDVLYHRPILTKGNFRSGDFKGDFNSGVYGRQDKKLNWEGSGEWKNGTLLNTLWSRGTIDSLYTQNESYLADFDENGIPYQKINGPDNNGRGFNYLIDSEFESSVINNGSVIESKFGNNSGSYSIVENHILSISQNYDNKINKAYFEKCKFYDSYVNNSEVKNSRSTNTIFENIKSINSGYQCSVIKNSNYLSDEIIKINGYDEFNISEFKSFGTFSSIPVSHKVYKFYVSRKNFERLKSGDTFYLKNIKIKDNKKEVIRFFDRKFRLGSWTEYIDDYSGPTPSFGIATHSFYKRGIEYSAFLSTPGDNEFRYTPIDNSGYYTEIVDENTKVGYSLDLVVSIYDINSPFVEVSGIDFNRDHVSPTSSTPIMNSVIGDIIDISKSYIIDSEFESGLFETSNWNSGRHINFNNDTNITLNTVEGGYYNLDIITSSSTLIATTPYNVIHPESTSECLSEGKVVFLNNVDYDTIGKVLSITLSASGSGYTQSETDIPTIGGSGTGLTIDYTADTIGSILTLTNLYGGFGIYSDGSYTNAVVSGGVGSGATVDYDVVLNLVVSATISNTGVGYQIGDTLTIDGGDATIDVATITNGEILTTDINSGGIGYQVGDLITINDGDVNAIIEVISITGSITTLPDTYKILSNINGVIELEEVVTGTYAVLPTLLDGGIFYTSDASNRYGYIHKAKFNRSKIKGGLFRRSYIKGSLIENESYDVNDKDFNNLEKIRSLVISDSIFRNNDNILSKSLYMNSSIVNGTDIWENGLGYNLIWNGSTFKNGTIKRSRWINGDFKNGHFYDSRSFDASPTAEHPYYYNENIKSYYKDGLTTGTISNNRYSWQSGNFNGGEVFKSDWESGIFNGGKFYYSKWYSGLINNGTIGDIATDVSNTHIYNGTINYTTVENATLYSIDTSWYENIDQSIDWKDGIFNGGLFGSDTLQSANHTATWSNGIFNGGQFTTNGKWKNGTFNGGKFLSSYGWTLAGSLNIEDYGWEDGIFNGGEFGDANLGTNSTWYTGEFNGGVFKGRWWNNGVFTSGEFHGSSTYSSVGGYNVDGMTVSNAYNFVESYTQSYYGLWNDGYFTDIKDKFIKDKKLYSIIERSIKRIPRKTATIKNALWISGTFSHPSGEFNNSVWLDGGFEAGTFKSSSFNPWVIRPGDVTQSFNLNDDLTTGSGSCVWYNGRFDDSDFYISQWNGGRWLSGTAFGMIWKDGIANYMNAYNICWHNGTWRNGNWQGSYFNFDVCINDPFNKQIVFRVMNCAGTSSMHVWNVFKGEQPLDNIVSDFDADTPIPREIITNVKK